MKLSKRQQRMWRYMIRRLKARFDPGVPVEVQTVPLKGDDGNCQGVLKLGRLVKIVIRINQKTIWKVKADTLMHEWAHAMEWSANWVDGSPKKDHGETWGVWYAKIYQHLIDECWEEMARRGLVRAGEVVDDVKDE